MQEEVTGKAVALIIDGAKMSEQVLEIASLYLLGNTYRNQNEQDFRVISEPDDFGPQSLLFSEIGLSYLEFASSFRKNAKLNKNFKIVLYMQE